MNTAGYVLCAAAAYLTGAIPSGYIIARSRGVDIRKVGSCNIGATNVFRTLGRPWGILTFVADALKGFVPACVFPLIARHWMGYEGGSGLSLLCAVMAIAGHNWPVYLGFKGGKGVATTAGSLLGIAPSAAGIGFAVWAIVFLATRYVSVASITTAIAVPASAWFLYGSDGATLPGVLSGLGALVVVRHKSNIRRLVNGTESRFARKPR